MAILSVDKSSTVDNGIFEAVFPFFRAEAVETYGEFAETKILPKTTIIDNGIFEIESSFFTPKRKL